MNSMKGIPAIRFNCFEGEWTLSKLDDVADFYDELRKPITESARESGPYPYYGASGIIDYVKDYIFDEEMILLSEDGANILDRNYRVCFLASGKYWVNNHAHVVKAKRGNNNFFICESLERLRYDKYNTGTAQPKINQDVCKKLPLYTTSNDEQTAIGNYFQKLDSLIKQHQQKHDKLSHLKKAMLEKMFPKQGETVPEIRFKGFSGEWKEKFFGACFANVPNNTLSRAELNYRVGLAKNIHYGDVLIKFGETLDADSELIPFITNNEVVNKLKHTALQSGDIVIADAAEDNTVGKCTELLNVGELLVFSGLHTIAVRATLPFASKYLGYYLNSASYHDQLSSLMQGTKVLSISKTAIQNTLVVFPKNVEEQTAIGNYFQKLDTLINQHQQQITKLTNIKQACLSKMFI